MLAPVVTWLQRWLGRIGAVLLVVEMMFAATGAVGWGLTRHPPPTRSDAWRKPWDAVRLAQWLNASWDGEEDNSFSLLQSYSGSISEMKQLVIKHPAFPLLILGEIQCLRQD